MDFATLMGTIVQPMLAVICYKQMFMPGFWRNLIVFTPISAFGMYLAVDGPTYPVRGLIGAVYMAILFVGAIWLPRWFGERKKQVRED